MSSSFIHVVSNGRIPLFKAEQYSTVYHIFFIHLSTDILVVSYLGCYEKCWDELEGANIIPDSDFISLDVYPEVGLLINF